MITNAWVLKEAAIESFKSLGAQGWIEGMGNKYVPCWVQLRSVADVGKVESISCRFYAKGMQFEAKIPVAALNINHRLFKESVPLSCWPEIQAIIEKIERKDDVEQSCLSEVISRYTRNEQSLKEPSTSVTTVAGMPRP